MAAPEVTAPEAGSPKLQPKPDQPFFYGGQAVIEGVMMRGKRHYAVAVRLPNTKEIVVDRGELKASIYVNPIWKLPFVRGLALIGEQLHLGMKSLIWSANMNAGGKDIVIGKKEITGSVIIAGVFALAIFLGLPLLLAGVAVHRSGSFQFVLVEGIVRIVLVLGYLSAISLLPDVRGRVPSRRAGGERDRLQRGRRLPSELVLAHREPRACDSSHRRRRLRG